MQIDNEIRETDLAAMERLDRDCLALHLLPPPKTFINLEVSDGDGKLVSGRKVRSQSWNRNAYNYVMMAVACLPAGVNGTVHGPGTLRMTDISGEYGADRGYNEYSNYGDNAGGAGVVNKGIVVGKSNAAEDFNGVALKGQYAHGTAASFGVVGTPDVLPNGPSYDLKISPDGAYLVYTSQDSTEKVVLYKVSGDSLTKITGFGSELTTYGKEVCWSADSQYLLIRDSDDMTFVYRNNGDDTFTMIHSTTSYYGMSVSPDGKYFVFSPQMPFGAEIYKIVDGVFTKVADINWGGMAINQGGQVWSGDGKYLSIINDSSNVAFYQNNGDDTFTQLSSPITFNSQPQTHAWSKNGDFYVVSKSESPYWRTFNVSGDGTFVEITSGVPVLSNEPYEFSLSQDDAHSVIGVVYSMGINSALYKLSGGTWSSVETGSVPGYGKAVAVHPDLAHFAFGADSGPNFLRYCAMTATLEYLAQEVTGFAYDTETKKATATLTRTFNNKTSVSVPVRELAIYQYGSGAGYNYMMSRDVLASPVVVPPSCKLTVTYSIEMTFPA